MNNNLEKNELDEKCEEFRNRSIRDIKSYFILIGVIALVVVIVMICIIVFFGEQFKNMKMPSSEVFFPCAILVTIIFCPTLAFIMKLIESRKNAGKSTFTFKIRNDYMYDINDRLQAILKELKYKPKKYKGQMVFYSYKDSRLPINTHSRKRYLSYTISNNTLIVEVWVTILGSEHPLDNGRYMQFSKESLLWDLEYIAKNIS